MESIRKEMEASGRQTQIILGAIGAITLLVATISIANTMVMSVYERTREIGVMKVLGCLVSNIRTIFLVEAGLIGFFGGIMGIALSFILSFLINNIGANLGGRGGGGGMMFGGMGGMGGISVISPWMVGLGLAFATTIGLLAGFYPAYRAVKISALEAIKQE
jgi:ABC-type antimicrobial peptide transport system permease subunit